MSKNNASVTRKPEAAAGAAPTPAQPAASLGPAASVEIKPNPEAVRRRAYELYLERARTGKPGNDIADWVQAEKELHGRK